MIDINDEGSILGSSRSISAMNAIKPDRFVLFLLLVFSLSVQTVGQTTSPEADLQELYSWGDDYFLEVLTLPGKTDNKSRVVVLVRLTYDLLTFRKTTKAGSTSDHYVAAPSVYIEAQGGDGVVVDYDSWNDTVETTEYRLTNSKLVLATSAIELEMRPGTYTITYAVDDGSPGRRFSRTTDPFVVPDFGSGDPAIGRPIFLKEKTEHQLSPVAIDGDAPFGQPIRFFVPLASREAPTHLRAEFLSVHRDEKEGEILNMKSIGTGVVTFLGSVIPGEFYSFGSEIVAPLHRDSIPDGVWGAYCEFEASTVEPGQYAIELTYTAGELKEVDTLMFRVKWINMPFSLSSPAYAIKALWPIATDDEIDALLDVGKEGQEKALWDYWKELDRTPGTLFNERMAEYYRRVDYAFFNFATLKEHDGVFTDRGKIYILFGPPTETRREFDPDSNPKEIWTYNNVVNREFVFRDQTESGAYRLVEYYDL
ncbi:MAG: GWxTD domain-containing protein [Chlorobi bacterium]|nr:GWxTD domain-containing protein [Chlorobiota bacterium]